MVPLEDDPLVKSLGLLKMHMASMVQGRETIRASLDTFDESSKGLARKAEDVNTRLILLETQMDNVQATRRTVVKVADKFNDSAKASAMLDRGADLALSELISSIDALREAVRYASSLNRTVHDKAGELRLEEQRSLLDRAAVMLDQRMRALLTAHIRPAEYKLFLQKRTVTFIEEGERGNLSAILMRMHGVDHIREFSATIKKVLETSLNGAKSAVISAEQAKGFYHPGSHPVLSFFYFFHTILDEAQMLGKDMFGVEEWIRFQASLTDPTDATHLYDFCGLAVASPLLTSTMEKAAKMNVTEHIYVLLDLCSVFTRHSWELLPKSTHHGTKCPQAEWKNLQTKVFHAAGDAVVQFCSVDLSKPLQHTPQGGTVHMTLVQALHLISLITKHYGEKQFDNVLLRSNGSMFYRDFVDEVTRLCLKAVASRTTIIKEKKKGTLSTIFALNNVHHVYSQLKDLGVGWIVQNHCDGLRAEIQELMGEYIGAWAGLGELMNERRQMSKTGMKDEDKRWLKTHFKSYNELFDTILDDEADHSIPNSALRKEVIKAVIRTAVEPYKQFCELYVSYPFTSQIDKYYIHKPTPGQGHALDTLVNQLYLAS